MIDPTILRLLEQAVDTPIKLQLLLLFHENPRLAATAPQIGQRIFRDIWSTREALRELAADGVLLAVLGRDEPVYHYRPAPERLDGIRRLMQSFNEPLERDTLQRMLRQLASDAPCRRAEQHGATFEQITI